MKNEAKKFEVSDCGFVIVEDYHYHLSNGGKPEPMVVNHIGDGAYQAYPTWAVINDEEPCRKQQVTFFDTEAYARRVCDILNQRKYDYNDSKYEVRPVRRTLTIG